MFELLEADLGPVLLAGGGVGGFFPGARGADLVPDAIEGIEHLAGVAVAFGGIDLEGFLEEGDEVGVDLLAEAVEARLGPVEGPGGEVAGEHLVDDEAEGEDIGAEGGFAHGLLGGDVAEGAGAGADPGAVGEFGDAEVGEAKVVVGEEDEVLGFDVAVHDALLVDVRGGLDGLVREVEEGGEGHAPLHAIGEGFQTEGIGDDEVGADVIGIFDADDVGGVELGADADLLAEGFEEGVVGEVGMGDFQGDADAFDGVEGAIDV